MINLLNELVFTPGQIIGIIAACVAFAAVVAINVVVIIRLRKARVRKLCTHQLQKKRDELLAKLNSLRDFSRGGETAAADKADGEPIEEEAAEEVAETAPDEEDITDDADDDDSDTDEDVPASAVAEETVEDDPESVPDADILAVREMSAKTREILGFAGEEYNRKQYYVRYELGFEAKLREADDTVKQYYTALVNEIAQYKGVKVKGSFRRQRVYKGNKTLGLIMIRGKTLCIAFALNPADYADTKYRGVDKSDKKRFEKTPMLFKITSNRRLEYAKYLLLQLSEANTILLADNPAPVEPDLTEKTRDELFLDKKLRLTILGEAPELDTELDEPDEEVAEIVEETTIAGSTSDKVTRRVMYNRSFAAKIIQANDDLKARYSELKNYILSYKGVTEKTSWKREAFKLGNKNVAAFAISGKTLCLFLATDPARFENTKYAVENMTGRRNSGSTPAMYRIKGDRRAKYAKQLIDIVMGELNVERTDRKPVDYTTPYKSTAALVRRGLIKQTETDRALPKFKTDKPSAHDKPENPGSAE